MDRDNKPRDRGTASRRRKALGLWGSVIKSDEDFDFGGVDDSPPPPSHRTFGRPPNPPRPPGTLRYLLSYLYVGSLLTVAALVFFALGFGWPMLQDHINQLPGMEKVNDYRPDLGSQLLAADGSL